MRFWNYVVGQLATCDVETLIGLARVHSRVLEFGAGGSTTIWSQFCPPQSQIWCVEDVPEWRRRGEELVARCTGQAVTFVTSSALPGDWIDLAFIDGSGDRIVDAGKVWPILMPGGIMAWHDTHRPLGGDVFRFLAERHLEVGRVECHPHLYLATKAVHRTPDLDGSMDHSRWRREWQIGNEPPPNDWPRRGPQRGEREGDDE
jgi:hypothetical protein